MDKVKKEITTTNKIQANTFHSKSLSDFITIVTFIKFKYFAIMQEVDNMEEHNQTIWNFDGAELQFIFSIKNNFTTLLDKWDLENAYWSLRLLRREVDAALKRINKKKNLIEEQVDEEKHKEGRGNKGKETEKAEIDLLPDLFHP